MNCNWGGTDLKSLHIYIYVGKTFKNHFFETHELQYHVTSSRKIHGTKRERERERKRESKREKGRRKSEGKNGKERGKRRRDGTKVQQCSVGACIETKRGARRGAHVTVPRWHRLKRGRRKRLRNSKEGRGLRVMN